MSKRKPVVIDLEAEAPKPKKRAKVSAAAKPAPDVTPATAPPVEDLPTGRTAAVETGLRIAARRPSVLARLFWGALVSLILFMAGVFFWDFVAELLSRNLWLGRIALGLLGVVILVLGITALKELASLSRLRRIDGLRAEAEALGTAPDLADVRRFEWQITRLYRGREDLRWAFDGLAKRSDDVVDGAAALDQLERGVMNSLDQQATEAVETAARQVATATAIVPLALADVVVALTANLRMIRQIAQIYGGRSGTLGSWRLTKAVAAHLVATGAVAIGDDLIGSIAGITEVVRQVEQPKPQA